MRKKGPLQFLFITAPAPDASVARSCHCVRVPDLRPRGIRKHRQVNYNLAGTRLILSDAVLAELSQARRTYRLSQQETD